MTHFGQNEHLEINSFRSTQASGLKYGSYQQRQSSNVITQGKDSSQKRYNNLVLGLAKQRLNQQSNTRLKSTGTVQLQAHLHGERMESQSQSHSRGRMQNKSTEAQSKKHQQNHH